MINQRCPTFNITRAIVLVGFWVLVLFFLPSHNVIANVVPKDAPTSEGENSRVAETVGDPPPASGEACPCVSEAPGDPAVTEKQQARLDEEFELQQMLVDTLDQVERNYVKGISRRELIEAAIEGVLRKLDPYSTYINPEKLSEFRTSVEHEFGGIGIRVGVENGLLVVISPMVGTPAYESGVLAGDRIIEIDGKTTKDLSLDDAVEMLQGPIDTDVTLTLLHRYSRDLEKITVKRCRIVVETVLGDRRKPDGQWDFFLEGANRIGYVQISAFSRTTPEELRKVLKQLTDEGVKAIVLDLRFNPGGLLSSAVEVSDLFLSKGRIVSIAGRNTKQQSWDAKEPDTFDQIPIVVLVNRFTASAAEIVAAALQDNQRATILGERTWGKGSVQNVISLEHGHSALKLTTSAYQRPSGENIHRFPDATEEDKWGVSPNKDDQLRIPPDEMKALLLDRQRRDVVRSSSSKDQDPPHPRLDVDRLLRKAVDRLEKR